MTDPIPDDARPISPGAARRRLGSDLRSLRESAGLKLEDAGRHLQRSAATISRLESAKVIPRLVDIAALLELYSNAESAFGSTGGAGARTPPCGGQPQEAVVRAVPGRHHRRHDPGHVRRLVEYETDAREIRTYEPEIIPGLLQTRAYAIAVTNLFFPQHAGRAAEPFCRVPLGTPGHAPSTTGACATLGRGWRIGLAQNFWQRGDTTRAGSFPRSTTSAGRVRTSRFGLCRFRPPYRQRSVAHSSSCHSTASTTATLCIWRREVAATIFSLSLTSNASTSTSRASSTSRSPEDEAVAFVEAIAARPGVTDTALKSRLASITSQDR